MSEVALLEQGVQREQQVRVDRTTASTSPSRLGVGVATS
jgi:hypothetical protein